MTASESILGEGGFVDEFFRRKWRDVVVVLSRRFGAGRLELIENAVQSAFVKALEAWPRDGVPGNPGGWILTVANNQMLDTLRREKTVTRSESEVQSTFYPATDAALWMGPLEDDVLKMILVCCHPALSERESLVITLRIVCGLGVLEIAQGLLSNEEAVRKLLSRARQRIREHPVPFELPGAGELPGRLERALRIIYLLFNEGYCCSVGNQLVRDDLCAESQRLVDLLLESSFGAASPVWALGALIAFQRSRLPARADAQGRLVRLLDQDRALWDRALIALGCRYLDRSIAGNERSRYHIEAAIAACHALATTAADTDWARIRELYDDLMELSPSPIVELNRAVAVMHTEGPLAAIAVLDRLTAAGELSTYHLLPALLGDFHSRAGNAEQAERYYRQALDLVRTEPVRDFLIYQSAMST